MFHITFNITGNSRNNYSVCALIVHSYFLHTEGIAESDVILPSRLGRLRSSLDGEVILDTDTVTEEAADQDLAPIDVLAVNQAILSLSSHSTLKAQDVIIKQEKEEKDGAG